MDENGYNRYQTVCSILAASESYFQSFKSVSEYNNILEHLNPEQGKDYLKECLQRNISLIDIHEFCKINDTIGNPQKAEYVLQLNSETSFKLECSPTSLRYVFHSYLILKHIQELGLTNINIVEVGGGYGGLLLALDFFAKKFGISIQSYTILDLPEANMIQIKYLSFQNVSFPYFIKSGNDFGSDLDRNDYFFISNYCLSEISDNYRISYIENLLPKCPHGFLAWNMQEYKDIGKTVRFEDEVPPICPEQNRMIYF
jgi:hypothetical protein